MKESESFSSEGNAIYNYFEESKLRKENKLSEEIKELLKDDFADEIALSIIHSIFLSKVLLPEWSWHDNNNKSFLDRLAENLPNELNSIKELFSKFKNIIEQIHKNNEKENKYREDIWSHIQEAGLELWEEEVHGVIEKGKNPFIEFRKKLLAKYYPKIITGKDIYYIPEEIVDCMVRLSEKILIEKLNLRDGLADPNVAIIEPTAGIGFFAAKVIGILQEKIYNQYCKKINEILGRIFAFETNFYGFMFALTNFVNKVANFSFHYKCLEQYSKQDSGQDTKNKKSFKHKSKIEKWKEVLGGKTINFFHENVLEGNSYLNKIKEAGYKTFLIIGAAPLSKNPIYNTEYASKLIENYKNKGGSNVGDEHAVNANYVKFIAFAENEISRKEKGVVAYVTNSNFLISKSLAYMRRKLLETFDLIYIINLKDKTKKAKITEDKNILNISSGVCIFFGVKSKQKILENNGKKDNNSIGCVFYASWEEIWEEINSYKQKHESSNNKARNQSICDISLEKLENKIFKKIENPSENIWIYETKSDKKQPESAENQPETVENNISLESRVSSNLGYKRTRYFIIS